MGYRGGGGGVERDEGDVECTQRGACVLLCTKPPTALTGSML